MVVLRIGFNKIKTFSEKKGIPKTGFSVVIPFRNEAKNLVYILNSIEKLNYPSELFEIIFVNDASEDSSEVIIQKAKHESKIDIKLIQNNRVSNSPKKDAITRAIESSIFEWIVTSDADCEVPKSWLEALDTFIQAHNPIMVCAPVIYKSDGSFLQAYQQLDGLSLQAVTIGSFGLKNPLLSNGANLAYLKTAFSQVNGFLGNDHIASGDDIFLLEKMKKAFPEKVLFLKSQYSIVATKPQQTWEDTINQRVRWASKTSKQGNLTSIILGLLVSSVNILILVIPFLIVFNAEKMETYLILIFLKLAADILVIHQAAQFFNVKFIYWKVIPQVFTYALVMTIVVIKSLKGSYSWKGRTF
ncbi:glycosyltransferase family 2 protein [Aequorivita sediminis]|uniref:glycosyltransferase family 2 protein n=1 Tax=Aequorivita sediminis TaxID=3073653 RepID=UPI0028AD4D40|nr:glycosyltransferase [Aequorivita sp. F6058]